MLQYSVLSVLFQAFVLAQGLPGVLLGTVPGGRESFRIRCCSFLGFRTLFLSLVVLLSINLFSVPSPTATTTFLAYILLHLAWLSYPTEPPSAYLAGNLTIRHLALPYVQ